MHFQEFLGNEKKHCILWMLLWLTAIISRGYNGDSSIPEIPSHAISMVDKSLVVDMHNMKLSRHDWKMEQQTDPDIGLIVTLINSIKIAKYFYSMLQRRRYSSRMRVLLKYWEDLVMKEGLLYRKVLLKGQDQPIKHFVLSKPFRHKTMLAGHDDFGQMGMEKSFRFTTRKILLAKNGSRHPRAH